jgi:hypothetical protein
VSLNLLDEEGIALANQLGCKVSTLSLIYLGMSLHWKKLYVEHWNFLLKKLKTSFKGGKRNFRPLEEEELFYSIQYWQQYHYTGCLYIRFQKK